MRTLVVFEDHGARTFEVLTCVRAVFDLRCGAQTLLERITSRVEHDRLVLLPLPEQAELVGEIHPDAQVGWTAVDDALDAEFVFVNGRLLAMRDDANALVSHARARRSSAGTAGGGEAGGVALGTTVVAAHCDAAAARAVASALQGSVTGTGDAGAPIQALARRVESVNTLADLAPNGSVLLEHVWELVQYNHAAILDDFECGPGAGVSVGARIDPGVRLMNDRNIRLEEGVRLRPGVVLDAEEGPVTLAAGVDVQPQVVVRGPAWIGPDCLLKAGGRIHAGTSVGPVCKLGGEIEASILQGYANKQHEGFLGHAFLAEWVNLGADTNNSDLKNNYSSVRMWEAGEFVDTGRMFVGLVAADHVKSAINTQFNTGTVVGLASQVFGAGFPPKYVPPFSWGAGSETYELERALDTARAVMGRRERELTPAYEAAFRRAYARAHASRDKPRP